MGRKGREVKGGPDSCGRHTEGSEGTAMSYTYTGKFCYLYPRVFVPSRELQNHCKKTIRTWGWRPVHVNPSPEPTEENPQNPQTEELRRVVLSLLEKGSTFGSGPRSIP